MGERDRPGGVSNEFVGAGLAPALCWATATPPKAGRVVAPTTMRFGLILYGSLDTVSGGYLYDRMLVNHLRERGDTVDLISLTWRNYAARLADNFSPTLHRRLREGRYDALLQDELNHPSLFLANRITGARRISIVHHLRASEHRPAWQNLLYRFVERRYLDSVDGFVFNSQTTLAAVDRLSPLGQRPHIVAHPAGNRFGPPPDPDRIRDRATRPGPIHLLFVGNLILRKGLRMLLDALGQIEDGWELNVAGSLQADARYAESIRRIIAQRGLSQVTLLGSLDESQLGARLRLFPQSAARRLVWCRRGVGGRACGWWSGTRARFS